MHALNFPTALERRFSLNDFLTMQRSKHSLIIKGILGIPQRNGTII